MHVASHSTTQPLSHSLGQPLSHSGPSSHSVTLSSARLLSHPTTQPATTQPAATHPNTEQRSHQPLSQQPAIRTLSNTASKHSASSHSPLPLESSRKYESPTRPAASRDEVACNPRDGNGSTSVQQCLCEQYSCTSVQQCLCEQYSSPTVQMYPIREWATSICAVCNVNNAAASSGLLSMQFE